MARDLPIKENLLTKKIFEYIIIMRTQISKTAMEEEFCPLEKTIGLNLK